MSEDIKYFTFEKAMRTNDAKDCLPSDCLKELSKHPITKVVIAYEAEGWGYAMAGCSLTEAIGMLEIIKSMLVEE